MTVSLTSTVVYDTLVRAGVKCTSVLITPDESGEDELAAAQCSRGVRIVPDISQSQLSASKAVCLVFFFPSSACRYLT
jgi:protein DJ-1